MIDQAVFGARRRRRRHERAERLRIEHEADMIESNHRESQAAVRWAVGSYSERDLELLGAELERRKRRRARRS